MAEVKTSNPCATPVPPPEPPKPPCPSCIPDSSYIEPTWYTTEEPYLNKKTCEYMISVTVNSRGDSHSPSTIKKSKLPFKKLLKTYIRPGVRLLLRHFDKLETDKIVCASYVDEDPSLVSELDDFFDGTNLKASGERVGLIGVKDLKITAEAGPLPNLKEAYGDSGVMDSECRDILDVDLSDFLKERKKSTNIQGSESYTILNIDKKLKKKFPQVKNLNALELYALAKDYHFTGYADSIMKVLIAIPAYIFDQIPQAPELPEVNTSPQTLFISPRRLRTDLAKLREAIGSFAQFQAFFYRHQNGSLYHKESGEKFYIKFYSKRLELFENRLETLLTKNGFTYSTFGGFRTPSMPWKIKFVFDTSDEKRPFTLKRVGAKIEGCPYQKLSKGLKSFLKKVNKDQTLLGFIANFEDIMSDLNARETIGWLDFSLKYIYPDLAINYGSSEKIKEGQAVNCLADKLGLDGIDDFVHDAVGRFSELFLYAVNKEACRSLSSKSPVPIAIKEDGSLDEKYFKEWERNKLSKIGEPSILEEIFKDIKESYDAVNGSDDKLKKLLQAMNPCNFFELTLKAIQCLMSQMSFKDSMRVLAKKALSSMAGAALEKVIEGLPQDKQERIRALVKQEFGNMPAPWETGYRPGSLDKAIDQAAERAVFEKSEKVDTALQENASLATKAEDMIKRVEELQFCLSNPEQCTIEGRRRELTQEGKLKPLAPLLTSDQLLSRGSKGEPVTTLQNALKALGYTVPVNGEFDSNTKKAVTMYQKTQGGLEPNGQVGDDTRNHINQRLKEQGTTGSQDTGSLTRDLLIEEGNKEDTLKTSMQEKEFALQSAKQTLNDLNTLVAEQEAELGSYSDAFKAAKQDLKKYTDSVDKKNITLEQEQEIDGLKDDIEEIKDTIRILKQDIARNEDEVSDAKKALKSAEKAKTKADAEYTEYIDNATSAKTEDRINKIKEDLISDWKKEIEKLNKEKVNLGKKVSANDKTLDELNSYQLWDISDPDEKEYMESREREKYDKALVSGLSPDDDIDQGTFGTAAGNVQQAITMAYVEAIMETAEIQELISIIDKVPGVKLIGNFLAGLNCPVKSFIYPPISSFLSSLTFDPCGPGNTRLALPTLQNLPTFNGWNFLRLLANAFVEALKRVVTEIIFAILFKLLSIVFDIGCKTLAAAGRAVGAALTGDVGWRNAIDDFFCGNEKPEDERDDHAAAVLNLAAPSLPSDAAKDVAMTMSLIGTKKEYMRAISSNPEDQDLGFMKNLATFIAAKHPEHAEILGTPEKMTSLFSQVGNLLTASQIQNLRDLLEDEDESPLDESICLTDDQLELWNNERARALEEAGLDPETAKDFIDRQNERRKSDLADIADIMTNGPDGLLGQALDNALSSPSDPDCKVSTGVSEVLKNEQFQDLVGKATEGMFKRLEAAFLDDMILWRWPIDPRAWNDTPGILSTILADKQGYTLNFHFIARNNIFFKLMRFTTFFLYPTYEEFPDTVGKVFRDKLTDLDFSNGADNITIQYPITDDYSWKSNIKVNDTFRVDGDNGGKVYVDAFDYKFKQKSPENILKRFRVERTVTTEFKKWMNENKLTASESELKSSSYKSIILKKYLLNIFEGFNAKVTDPDVDSIIDGLNSIASKKIISAIVSQDGGMSPAFTHGSKNTEITADHLEYVAPNGGEYDFDEDAAVFGRAKKSHPRIQFLDPSEYGGSFTNPDIYIAPPKEEGLMEISKVFLPEMKDGCSPKVGKTHFLFIDDLKDTVDKAMNSITPHKKLQFAPECVQEYPYDKVASPATLGSLEGSVIATIRVYISHFLVKTMPIWSSLSFDPKIGKDGKPTSELANYDELISEYIVQLMERGLSNESSFFARAVYERWPYWLLFLEQAAQTVKRRVKSGEIKENIEITKAFRKINELQNDHIVPTLSNMTKIAKKYQGDINASDLEDDYLAESIVRGGALIGGITNRGDLPENGLLGTIAWSVFGLNQAKFAAKIWTLYKGRKAAMSLLKYLVTEQLQFYQGKLRERLQGMGLNPFYYDISRVFIGSHGAALGKAPQSGIWPTSGISEGETRDFGTVNDVSDSPESTHTLSGVTISNEDYEFVKSNGGIYLEKYVRLYDDSEAAPVAVTSRPDSLKGVISEKAFKQFLTTNLNFLGADTRLSELFSQKDGSMGALYGVRVCYIPPTGTRIISKNPSNADKTKALKEKSYINAPASVYVSDTKKLTLNNTRHSFPLVSCEIALPDATVAEVLESGKNLDQDLKCYIDQLVATEEFELVFDKIINLKRAASLSAVATYDSWVPSIGAKGSGERLEPEVPEAYEDAEEEPPTYSEPANTKYFNDSTSECRKLFISNYKRSDFDPKDDEEDYDFVKDGLNRMLSNTYSAVLYGNDVPFWRKWKVTTNNPNDREGNACGNAFTKLFKKNKGG